MNDVSPSLPRSLGESITQKVRRMLVEGELAPGQRLSEAALAESLQISRNTLREAFRVLTREGLLKHEPNRGVTVAEPDMASIIDIYRVRRFIECKAIAQGDPLHPGALHMREAVEVGIRAREVPQGYRRAGRQPAIGGVLWADICRAAAGLRPAR